MVVPTVRRRGRTRRVLSMLVQEAAYRTHTLSFESYVIDVQIVECMITWQTLELGTDERHRSRTCLNVRKCVLYWWAKVGKWYQINVNDWSAEFSYTVTLKLTFILYLILNTTSVFEKKKNLSLATNLTLVQKGVLYSGSRIYNHLPLNIKILSNDAKRFKSTLKSCLIEHTFYNLDEYYQSTP